jgi:hypothetical protein
MLEILLEEPKIIVVHYLWLKKMLQVQKVSINNKTSMKIEKKIKYTCPGKTIRVFNLLSWSNSDGVKLN